MNKERKATAHDRGKKKNGNQSQISRRKQPQKDENGLEPLSCEDTPPQTRSESPEGRRGEAGSRIGTLERQGGSRKGNPVAKPQNLTTQRCEPPRQPQPPKDPNATFEYWRRPRTLCLKRRNADSKTELGAGEKGKHKEPGDGDTDIRTEARRRRSNRRTKWLKGQRTTIKRKQEQGRKHQTPEQKTNTRRRPKGKETPKAK